MNMLVFIGSFTYICLGFGGFVPRTHLLFGKSYEHVTPDTLNLFTDECHENSDLQYFCGSPSLGFEITSHFEAHSLGSYFHLVTNSVRKLE